MFEYVCIRNTGVYDTLASVVVFKHVHLNTIIRVKHRGDRYKLITNAYCRYNQHSKSYKNWLCLKSLNSKALCRPQNRVT